MLKRVFDIIGAITVLFLASPFFIMVSLASLLFFGRPIFFRQDRPGLNGAIFKMIKFRTMSNARDVDGHLLPDDVRLASYGKFLRSTSLDELPELWNVIKGDMSLVGPRPLLVSYLPLYDEKQLRRHEVRPGITGWAQVSGRNALSWEQKFALDIYYVDHQSLWFDMKILWLTLWTIINRKGISADDNVTMPIFKGTKNGK